jgi:ABC-type multidrug transport system fused ATPase/permease subunit
MPESRLIPTEVNALHTLERLSVERATTESETEVAFAERKDSEARAFRDASQRLASTAKAETEATQAKYESVKHQIRATYEADQAATQQEYNDVRKKIALRASSARSAAKKDLEETRWQALAVYEASKDGAIKQLKEHEKEIEEDAELLSAIKHEAAGPQKICKRFAVPPAETGDAPPAPPPESPLTDLKERLKTADERLAALVALRLPKFLNPSSYVWPFILLALAAAYPLITKLGTQTGLIVDGIVTIVLAVGVWFWLATVAKKKVSPVYQALTATFAECDRLVQQSKTWSKAEFERRKAETEKRREDDVRAADRKHAQRVSEAEERLARESREADAKYPVLLQEHERRRDDALNQADQKYPRRLAEIREKYEADSRQLQENYQKQQATTQRLHEEAWNTLYTRWRDGLAAVDATAVEVNREVNEASLDWNGTRLDAWKPPQGLPPGLRFGQFVISLKDIPHGISADPRLVEAGPTTYTFPALLGFPVQGSILIKALDSGRTEAVQLLQTLMLRYLTSLPPGKVRYTIIDPVGLGENFAAFMHLADYHELLVTSRIWTETPHIEQRLADLSAHMENVIQKYLRNEFQTIEEYNAFAGEVAEPFRILVVANFPASFSEQAARRLLSIVSSGPRCGVYTLLSVDSKLQLPSGIQLKDLEPHCVNFSWREGHLHWRSPDFGRFPLALDMPPDQDTYSGIMHKVGELARDANRVEVPFDFIAPTRENYWTSDSRSGVDIPLGRAGATKLQHLKLGKGTSQHVLIAGKTGSGKSTLLHALITNSALRYSPDELELYLIDFKKGVEFKVYAAMELPHARVIAVESEREFGLSVLQRLDHELKVRGDKFRELGVQDLRGYRDTMNGQSPLPRILLIVDEFQEFFVEDDKIASETSLLLDRLVRQGRAFGIHVNLGSQTLGGAFSLARSTLGQMAVRIALQCSEADAHLILSEENSAARLLTRPGEAIYNDANGMVEGNNFFQVVWLSDERREAYLSEIQELNRQRNRPPASQIVFEGNLPAEVRKNHLLAQLLQPSRWPEAPKADYAWLGEAIAIKDPTVAVFRPQSGSNLLIVGQNDVAALGIMSTALIGLAAQHDPTIPAASARFFLFDGSPADSINAGKLAKFADVVPHTVRDVTWRDLKTVFAELAEEVDRRQKENPPDADTVYLFIFDLQRFRDLRKADDDFGYSRYGEEKETPPSKLFANILRDGPPVGVHTIVWCDSLNNLNRSFDRQTLREFELRVLFQMSANDSSTLIDSPAGSKLGAHRALFHSEEEGSLEKFRAYGLPTPEWLDYVRQQLRGRAMPVSNGDPGAATEVASPETVENR